MHNTHLSRAAATLAATSTLALTLGLTSCGADNPDTTETAACTGINGIHKGVWKGNQDSPIGVVYAFKWAFHSDRDAASATALTHPSSQISTSAVRNGIADYPAGLDYCVAITRVDDSTVWVTTAASYPGKTFRPGYQVFTTTSSAPYRVTGIYDRYQPKSF